VLGAAEAAGGDHLDRAGSRALDIHVEVAAVERGLVVAGAPGVEVALGLARGHAQTRLSGLASQEHFLVLVLSLARLHRCFLLALHHKCHAEERRNDQHFG